MSTEFEAWQEAQLENTGEAVFEQWLEHKSMSEDWSQTFDDKGAAFWEHSLSGPDDDDIEQSYEILQAEMTEDYEYDDDDWRANDDSAEQEAEGETDSCEEDTEARIIEIIEWLSKSELARELGEQEGFFVPKGPQVRLQDGTVVEVLDWLYEEGIDGDEAIGGYRVEYTSSDHPYGERLCFLKIIIDAPFYPGGRCSEESKAADDFDEDIPF